MNTIELKCLPGLDAPPATLRGYGDEWWVSQKPFTVEGHRLIGDIGATPDEAKVKWNAMIDRIIEECRK